MEWNTCWEKAADIVLSIFDKLEMISDGTLLAKATYLQEMFTEYFQCLVQEYQEEQIRFSHLWVKIILWKLQAQQVESIIKDASTLLSDTYEWQFRLTAVNALGELGTNQPEVWQALVQALSDSDSDVREAATNALGKLGANQPEVLQALLQALSDPNVYTRLLTASALGELGAKEPDVLEALLQALSDPQKDVREAAASALGELGAKEPDVLEALLGTLLGDPSWSVRRAAVTVLAGFPIDRMAIAICIERSLKEKDPLIKGHFETNADTDALLFALQQVIGGI